MLSWAQAISIIEGIAAASSDFLFEQKDKFLIFFNYLILFSAKYARVADAILVYTTLIFHLSNRWINIYVKWNIANNLIIISIIIFLTQFSFAFA